MLSKEIQNLDNTHSETQNLDTPVQVHLNANPAGVQTFNFIEAIKQNNKAEFHRLLMLKTDLAGKKFIEEADQEQGNSPLHWAAYYGHIDFISCLLEKGLDINKLNNNHQTPLYVAAENGHSEAIKVLKAEGADVNIKSYGVTPVWIAAHYGHAAVITELKAAGADMNMHNILSGTTPVYIAAKMGHAAAVIALKAAGANVDITDKKGINPLYVAVKRGDVETVCALLEAGANGDVNSRLGTALEEAKRTSEPGHGAIVRLLEAHLKQYPNGIKTQTGTSLQANDVPAVVAPGLTKNSYILPPADRAASISDLQSFLKLVAKGEQDEAEAMLKENSNLALLSGNVTDLSNRIFTDITGFQYAVWALDWHMWTMIRKYLPNDAARAQAQSFNTGTWVLSHGADAQKLLGNLIKAYQTTIDLRKASRWDDASKAWVEQVSKAQTLLPAHVINEYCHLTRPFSPLPNFKEAILLPRYRTIAGGDWFSAMSTNGTRIGIGAVAYRGAWSTVNFKPHWGNEEYGIERDQNALLILANNRVTQRDELFTALGVESDPNNQASDNCTSKAVFPGNNSTNLRDKKEEEDTQKHGSSLYNTRIPVSNANNAFVARLDKSYKYSEADIACVIRQYKKLAIFQNAEILDVISNLGQNTPAVRLEQAAQLKKPIFGIFNIGDWHWTAFCILPEENKTTMLYKDSLGNEPPEALLTSIKEIFGASIQIKLHTGKEQEDGTSCGIFALENLRIMASTLKGVKDNFINNFESFIDFCKQNSANVLRQNEFAKNRVLGEQEAVREAELDEQMRSRIRERHRPEAVRIAAILKNSEPDNSDKENIMVLGKAQTLPTHGRTIGIEIFLLSHHAGEYYYQYRLRINNLDRNAIIACLRQTLQFEDSSYQLKELAGTPGSCYLDIDSNMLIGLEKCPHVEAAMRSPDTTSLNLLYHNLGILNATQQQEIQTILRKSGVQIQPTINSEKPAPENANLSPHLSSPSKPAATTSTLEKVDAKDLSIFLQLVAEGEQDKAEAMLQNNKALALMPGDVTDLSKRTFTHITGFQYAVWALDWHMWTMIRKYLPEEAAREQAQNFETGAWVQSHDAHAHKLLDNLIKAYQTTIGFFEQSKWAEGDKAWIEQVGGAQLLLPAHVINEYCNPTRAFSVSPNFKEDIAIPRNRSIKGGEWFTTLHNGGKLGETFAIYRAAQGKPNLLGVCGRNSRPPEETDRMKYNRFDQKNIIELAKARTAQREELITELKLKEASLEETRGLQQTVKEQSMRIEQLEKALSCEEKRRVELQEQFQLGKTIVTNQFKNLKNLNKHTLKKEPLLRTLQEHTNTIFCLQRLSEEQLISGSGDNTIKIYDLQNSKCLKTLQGHKNAVRCLQLLPDGKLASGSEDNTIKVWDLQSGNCLKTLTGHTFPVYCLQQLPGGELVSGSHDHTIKIWDIESEQCLDTLKEHKSYVYCLELLPSGELISSSTDHTIKIWDIQNRKCLRTLEGHTNAVYCLQLLPNGKLASASNDSTIKIWDVKNGKCLNTLREDSNSVYCLQQLPSGELVSGSGNGFIRVWDLQSGNCLQILKGHTNSVWCLQPLPSGELISGAYDSTIKVWDLTAYVLEKKLENQLSACAMQ